MTTSAKDGHIVLDRLSFAVPERQIIKNVSLSIPHGSIVSIMGPSGCGKTTLLRLITGQLHPTSGRVQIDGQTIDQLNRHELMNLRKRMGMLFQSGALFTHLNVFENVAYPLREHFNLDEDLLTKLVLMRLQAVGLRGARHLMPNELSGGMQKRAALARSTILDPDVMFYDEPLSGQDPITTGMLLKLIATQAKVLNMTSVMVSHHIRSTLDICDYVCVLAAGRLLAFDSPDHILKSQDPEVHQFIHGLPDGPVPFHYPAKPLIEDLIGLSHD